MTCFPHRDSPFWNLTFFDDRKNKNIGKSALAIRHFVFLVFLLQKDEFTHVHIITVKDIEFTLQNCLELLIESIRRYIDWRATASKQRFESKLQRKRSLKEK